MIANNSKKLATSAATALLRTQQKATPTTSSPLRLAAKAQPNAKTPDGGDASRSFYREALAKLPAGGKRFPANGIGAALGTSAAQTPPKGARGFAVNVKVWLNPTSKRPSLDGKPQAPEKQVAGTSVGHAAISFDGERATGDPLADKEDYVSFSGGGKRIKGHPDYKSIGVPLDNPVPGGIQFFDKEQDLVTPEGDVKKRGLPDIIIEIDGNDSFAQKKFISEALPVIFRLTRPHLKRASSKEEFTDKISEALLEAKTGNCTTVTRDILLEGFKLTNPSIIKNLEKIDDTSTPNDLAQALMDSDGVTVFEKSEDY